MINNDQRSTLSIDNYGNQLKVFKSLISVYAHLIESFNETYPLKCKKLNFSSFIKIDRL